MEIHEKIVALRVASDYTAATLQAVCEMLAAAQNNSGKATNLIAKSEIILRNVLTDQSHLIFQSWNFNEGDI